MDDRTKTIVGVGLLAALVVGFTAGSALTTAPAASNQPVTAHIVVRDAHNNTLYDGDVHLGGTAGNATVLGALAAAGRAGNFTYAVKEYPSLGAYVHAINGTEASGNDGWVFRVLHNGSWCWGSKAPDRTPLQDGDSVAWGWGGYQQGCHAAS